VILRNFIKDLIEKMILFSQKWSQFVSSTFDSFLNVTLIIPHLSFYFRSMCNRRNFHFFCRVLFRIKNWVWYSLWVFMSSLQFDYSVRSNLKDPKWKILSKISEWKVYSNLLPPHFIWNCLEKKNRKSSILIKYSS
jgi:hypothetical protein